MVDVNRLRTDAARGAGSRAPVPFQGGVRDDVICWVPVRHYCPEDRRHQQTVLFAHGGYGLFGTLDVQDSYRRRLASVSARNVIAVDYRLAPEHTYRDAVDDVVAVAQAVGEPPVLCGDSAGGAIAIGAAAATTPVETFLLTNPNLDLTLSSFDREAPDGPDWRLSEFAFTAWARPVSLHEAPRLHQPASSYPPLFIAVGEHDALLPEALAFKQDCDRRRTRCSLMVLPDAGHGFMGTDATAAVAKVMSEFLDYQPGSRGRSDSADVGAGEDEPAHGHHAGGENQRADADADAAGECSEGWGGHGDEEEISEVADGGDPPKVGGVDDLDEGRGQPHGG